MITSLNNPLGVNRSLHLFYNAFLPGTGSIKKAAKKALLEIACSRLKTDVRYEWSLRLAGTESTHLYAWNKRRNGRIPHAVCKKRTGDRVEADHGAHSACYEPRVAALYVVNRIISHPYVQPSINHVHPLTFKEGIWGENTFHLCKAQEDPIEYTPSSS